MGATRCVQANVEGKGWKGYATQDNFRVFVEDDGAVW